MKLTKYPGNPVLTPNTAQPWENLVVCNPGVWEEDGVFTMLYRAAGDDDDHVIRFGLATSHDGFHFERVQADPILSPSADGPDAGCIEDPRIVKLDGHYVVTYAYRAYRPRQYWKRPNNAAWSPEDPTLPPLLGRNMTASGLLVTDDFRSYRRLGRITRADVDDRDVILFPRRIGGRYWMLNRPMQWVGPAYGTEHPAIWIADSDSLLDWPASTLLARAAFPWERKIGGSTPPLESDHGWLVLYHGVDERGVYRVGALLLDRADPRRILARLPRPILEPEADFEWHGLYPHGVVFPTGNVVRDGKLFVYYGCADQTIGVATCDFAALVDYVRRHPL